LDESSTGLKPNVAGLLSYLFGLVSGLIFYLIETKSQFVRFHAAQSIIVTLAFIVISMVTWILLFIPFLGWLMYILIGLAGFVLWILLMVKAYQGERYKSPIAGDLAEKWAVRKI